MPIRALLIANLIVFSFVALVMAQSFNGMDSSSLMVRMHQYGFIQPGS